MRIRTKADRRERIRFRQRRRIFGTAERPRLAVFRSVTHIYVQAIDDVVGHTLLSASSVEPDLKARVCANGRRGGNVAGAEALGEVVAERLKEKGITRVVFDRGGNLYHGRVKAVADGARKAGLQF